MAYFIKVIAPLVFVTCVESSNNGNDFDLMRKCELLDENAWCLPENYNKNVDPFQFKETSVFPFPWNYTYDMMILEVAGVDDLQQAISFLMYFRVEWHDPRLQLNLNATEWKNSEGDLKDKLFIPSLTPLWLPDLEIFGLRSFDKKPILTESQNIRITPNKLITLSTYAEISITCKMDFTLFPFDRQVCEFLVTSYSRNNDTVKCNAHTTIGDEINIFDDSSDHKPRNLQYLVTWKASNLKRTMTFPFGSWEYCGFELQLERIRTKYLAEAYAPSCFFVILSWISFVIRPDAIPGRTMLLLNIFLVLIILMNSAKETSPDLNRINAIDIYIIVCNVHVFLAIMEYAVLLFFMKCFDLQSNKGVKLEDMGYFRENKKTTKVKKATITSSTTDTKDISPSYKDLSKRIDMIRCIAVLTFYYLDWISLIFFPFSFSIFNIYYWNNF